MFKNPQTNIRGNNQIIFSDFLSSVEEGEVVNAEIQGNNIKGLLSNGKFFTYAPNDPNLIEKLSDKGVYFSCTYRREDAITVWCIIVLVSNASINCCLDFSCDKCKEEKVERWDLEDLKQK